MLNVMRKQAGSWMIKVILFAIVIVFVFWGVGSFRSPESSKVAVVNDEIISLAEYRRTYNNLLDQYRQRFGSSLNDGMIEMLNVKRQALDQLIDRTLLLQEAKKLDLRVSDAEIAESIMNIGAFQNNGAFDNRRYRSILARIHLTPEEFEADQKNVMLGEKLTRIIMGAAKVSEAEAHQWYEWQNTSVNIDYVLFDPARYSDIKPSSEEIAAFFATQKENYKTDPMITARYVMFDPDNYRSEVSVDEDEITDYYDSNINDFKTEKTVEARHILIKLEPEADEEADLAAKTRAEAITKKAKAGEDFEELAKIYSEGPTKDRGGYLGKFQKSQMVKPFADQAFSMAPGEISQPVKTQFGWHVIKVESVEEASTKTIEQSKDQILDILIGRKARNLVYDKAEQFYEMSFEKDDLVKNAKIFDLAVIETEPFSSQGPDALGSHKGTFAAAAFALQTDEISDIQDIGGRYYLIQPTETIDAVVPEFDAVKAKVEMDLIKKMQTDKAREDAEAMTASLREGKAFEESAADYGVDVKRTGLFTRNESIPDIGLDREFNQAAFGLSSAGSTSQGPVEGSVGFYLLMLAERKVPAADGFENEKDDITSMLLKQKQRTVIQDWIDARRTSSQITIEKEYVE